MHKWVQGHRGTAACRNSCRSDASDAARSRAPGLLRWLATHHFRAMPTRRPRKRKKKDGGVVEVEAEPASTAVGAGGGIAAAARDTAAARAQRLQPDADNRSDEAHPWGVLVGHRVLRLFGDTDGADDECVGGQGGGSILPSPTSKEAEEVDSAYFIGTVRSYHPPTNRPSDGAEPNYGAYSVHFDDGVIMTMAPKKVFECSQLYDDKVSGKGAVRRWRFAYLSDICHVVKLVAQSHLDIIYLYSSVRNSPALLPGTMVLGRPEEDRGI